MNKAKLMIGIAMLFGLFGMCVAHYPVPDRVEVTVIELEIPPSPVDIIAIGVKRNIKLLRPDLPEDVVDWYANEIALASYFHDVPDSLMVAMISTESAFNPEAVSWAGAIGSTQVIPTHHPEMLYDVNDPSDNIMAGAYVLKKYMEACNGDWACAMKSYNIGITNYMNGVNHAAADRYFRKIKSRLSRLG